MQLIARYRYFFLCVLFSLPLLFIGIGTQHDWGDDFAQYITEAKNISEGKPYTQSNYIPNPNNHHYAPASYPAGFPLIMSTLAPLTGFSIHGFLLQISFFLALALIAGFYFFKTVFSEKTSLLLALLLVYNPVVLNLKWQVLADIPLLFVLVFYLNLRRKTAPKAAWVVVCGLLLCFACLLRSQTFLLVLAEVLALVYYAITYKRKQTQLKSSVLLLLTFLLSVAAIQFSIYATAPATLQFYTALLNPFDVQTLSITANLHYCIDILRGFFSLPAANTIIAYMSQRAGDFVFVLFFIGVFSARKKLLAHEYLIVVLQIGLVLVLPVKQGPRYLLPLLPLYVLGAALGLQKLNTLFASLKRKTELQFISGIYLLCSIYFGLNATYEKNVIWVSASYKVCLQRVKKLLPSNAVLVCGKPRYISLETGLKCTTYDDNFESTGKVTCKDRPIYFLSPETPAEQGSTGIAQQLQNNFKALKVIGSFTVYAQR